MTGADLAVDNGIAKPMSQIVATRYATIGSKYKCKKKSVTADGKGGTIKEWVTEFKGRCVQEYPLFYVFSTAHYDVCVNKTDLYSGSRRLEKG